MNLQRLPRPKLRIFAWTLFDFANTAFSVVIVTVIYSRYFTNQVAGGERWLWGLAVSISMFITAFLSPPLGAVADAARNRKLYLLLFTAVSVLCTGLLFFVQEGMIILGMVLFILANIGFEGGLVFYDTFLQTLTNKTSYGRVSGYGFAMGYLGALFVLLIIYLLLPPVHNTEYLFYVRLSFVVAALFFLFFSLPLFLIVPEPKLNNTVPAPFINGLREAKRTLISLFKDRQLINLARFLAAFFLYYNGISTVIVFASIFAADTLQLSDRDIIIFFAVIQTSAIIGSLTFGNMADKIGPKLTISITLILWLVTITGAYFVQSVSWFYIIGLIAGIAMGSSQSASRSLMALLTPKERGAEYFGFYDGLCGKASAIIGPLVYGLTADLTNERTAIALIGLFFLFGLIILQGVNEPEQTNVTASAMQ